MVSPWFVIVVICWVGSLLSMKTEKVTKRWTCNCFKKNLLFKQIFWWVLISLKHELVKICWLGPQPWLTNNCMKAGMNIRLCKMLTIVPNLPVIGWVVGLIGFSQIMRRRLVCNYYEVDWVCKGFGLSVTITKSFEFVEGFGQQTGCLGKATRMSSLV